MLLQLFQNLDEALSKTPEISESAYMKLKRGQKTPEMIAKRKITLRKHKIIKYQRAFLSLTNNATSNSLCSVMGITRDALNYDLKIWMVEGVTKRNGSLHNPYGKSSYLWSWNFGNSPFPISELHTLNEGQLSCLKQNQSL